MEPKIAIWLLTYNSVDFLDRCITQLRTQSYTNFDLYIFDDFSTDGTREFLEKMLLPKNFFLHLNCKNLGVWRNAENAINLITLEEQYEAYIWWQHDDYYEPDFLEKIVHYLDETVDISHGAISNTNGEIFHNDINFSFFESIKLFNKSKLNKNEILHHPSQILHGLFKKSVMKELTSLPKPVLRTMIKEEKVLTAYLLEKFVSRVFTTKDRRIYRGTSIFKMKSGRNLKQGKLSNFRSLLILLFALRRIRNWKSKLAYVCFLFFNFSHSPAIFPLVKKLRRVILGETRDNLERDIRGIHLQYSSMYLWGSFTIALVRRILTQYNNEFVLSRRNTFSRNLLNARRMFIDYERKIQPPKIPLQDISVLASYQEFCRERKLRIPEVQTFSHPSQHNAIGSQDKRKRLVKISGCKSHYQRLIFLQEDRIFGNLDDEEKYILNSPCFEVHESPIMDRISSIDDDKYMCCNPTFREYFEFKSDDSISQLQFFMFQGVMELIRVKKFLGNSSQNYEQGDFFSDLTPIDAKFISCGKTSNAKHDFKKPNYWDSLVRLSEEISKNYDCLRIDFLCGIDSFYIFDAVPLYGMEYGFWYPNTLDNYLGKVLITSS